MALDPETIKKEREKIPQIKAEGNLSKSKLIEHSDCIDKYASVVDTGTEKIPFEYSVLSGMCTTDSVHDILDQPFAENANVRLKLTEAEPHFLVTGDVFFTSPVSQTLPITHISVGALFLIVGIVVGKLLCKKK